MHAKIRLRRGLKKRKSLGPDEIPNEILTIFGERWTVIFLNTFNICLRSGVFEKSWKEQYLVFLRKEYKPLENASSYIPLYICGTFLEILIGNNLKRVSPMQFGFMRIKSTVDASNDHD